MSGLARRLLYALGSMLLISVLGPFGLVGYFAWMSVPGQQGANRHGLPVYHQDVSEVFS